MFHHVNPTTKQAGPKIPRSTKEHAPFEGATLPIMSATMDVPWTPLAQPRGKAGAAQGMNRVLSVVCVWLGLTSDM